MPGARWLAVRAVPPLAAGAAQALTPTSQERRVHVHIDAYDQNLGEFHFDENVAAPDFEPFSAGVDGWPSPPFPENQTTFQDSTIGARASTRPEASPPRPGPGASAATSSGIRSPSTWSPSISTRRRPSC
jgi:hypothetical protein